ncbi:MAG: filamentous hemagglutinin N-terminal domain-containing protein [Nitrospira sp.]|nr:MAG: filamentous hemagglutinin N-terminal domain-containing protein [Nitrospira sp.]
MTRRHMLLSHSRLAYSLAAPVIVCLGLLLQISTGSVLAQVTQTIGPGSLGTQVNQVGNVYEITHGTPAGSNLFHSFGDFSLTASETARFQTTTGSPDATIGNILGRVTGQNPSSIFGIIDSIRDYPGANLFLMNPNGIVFGPNAVLNVGGSVNFTTADYLRLSDGVRFEALPGTQVALLSTASVDAYGFLGSNPAAISVQGSQLTVANGTGLSLVGGNRSFTYTDPDTGDPASVSDGVTVTGGKLSSPNGEINLAVTASPGEFLVTGLQSVPNINGESFTSYGSAHLAPDSTIDVSGANTISIRGGQFVLSVNDTVLTTAESVGAPDTVALSAGSAIVTATSGIERGADVQVAAGSIQIYGASVRSTSTGEGLGGDVSITGQTVAFLNGGQVASIANGTGAGGAITINGTESVTISGFDSTFTLVGIPNQDGFVTSGVFTTTSSSGAGGSATIDAPMVSLDGGGSLVSAATGSGRGGDLSVTGNNVALTNGGLIHSLSGEIDPITLEARGSGQGGDISVTATESIHLTGGSLDVFTESRIFSDTVGSGKSGDLSVIAPNVAIENSAFLVTFSQGTGAAGRITVEASNLLSVSGIDEIFGVGAAISSSASGLLDGGGSGELDIYARTLLVEDGGSIGTTTSTSTVAGDIIIIGENFTIRRGAISTGSSQSGSTGTITLNATETITISEPFDPGVPVVVANIQEGSGGQGDIVIQAREILVTNGAEVFSSSTGTGAGRVTLEATESITVSTNGVVRAFGGTANRPAINLRASNIALDQGLLSSRTNVELDGGSISLNATAGSLSLSNGSRVLTNTLFSSGNAGSIVANATDSIVLSGGSTMESSSVGAASGNGGAVTLNAGNQATLSGTGTALRSTTAGSGNGGNINVTAGQSVTLTNDATISASSTGPGNAGDISINAGDQLILQNSSITTQANQASGGKIDIRAVDLVRLDNSTISTSVLDGTGGGGDINIDPNLVVLQNNSQILAQAIQGTGGNITITTPLFLADSSSLVSASSRFGLNGTVTIQSPTSNLSGSLGPLASKTNQAQSLVTQRCAALVNGQASSFVVAGREQLPADPGGWLTSPLYAAGTGLEVKAEGVKAEGERLGTGEGLGMRREGREADTQILSLRRLTPARFLMANFADSEATECHS